LLFQPKFGSNMDKPKCWVKNAIKIFIFAFLTQCLKNFITHTLNIAGLLNPNLGKIWTQILC